MVTTSYLTERINAKKALVEAYETAVLALISGQIQSYTLDTGQTDLTVTKVNIGILNSQIDGLLNQITVMEARINGGGTIARPGW